MAGGGMISGAGTAVFRAPVLRSALDDGEGAGCASGMACPTTVARIDLWTSGAGAAVGAAAALGISGMTGAVTPNMVLLAGAWLLTGGGTGATPGGVVGTGAGAGAAMPLALAHGCAGAGAGAAATGCACARAAVAATSAAFMLARSSAGMPKMVRVACVP